MAGRPQVFSQGMPTAPDVRRINEKFPPGELKVGQEVPHSQIAEVIGVTRDASRFRTVTNAWKKHLEDYHGLFAAWEGDHFRIYTDSEKVRSASRNLKQAKNRIRRGLKTSGLVQVSNLDEHDAATHHHNVTKLAGASGMLALKANSANTKPSLTDGKEKQS